MAIKLSPDELAVVRAHKNDLLKGNISWIQGDKEKALSEEGKGNVRAFMYERGTNIFKGMTSIPSMFFGKALLKEIVVPDTILRLDDNAFANSRIKSIICEDGVQEIGKDAFANSAVSNIELPNSINVIKDGAFSNCKNLKEIFLPDSLTELKANMFEGDDINIWANPRKGANRLKCPNEDIEWFKQHLFKFTNDSE